MLTCMARSKSDDSSPTIAVDQKLIGSNGAAKTLSTQIKDMALKASGAYRHCAPCAPHQDKFERASSSAGRRELEARIKCISSGGGSAATANGRRVVFVEEGESKEWVAQVEPGVLITFLSLLRGGSNDLKRIRFSREMFNKWQAQKWWAENSEKVMELYNVQRLNRQAFPLPTTPKSVEDSPMTPRLDREQLPPSLNQPIEMGTAHSLSDSLDHQSMQSRSNNDSCGVTSTPKLSSIDGANTETLSIDVSMRTSLSRDADCSGEISIRNGSEMETEWVEQDEPGVHLTIRVQPDGGRELRRVRFSREKFAETHARLWWEENRARIHKQYL